MIHEICRCALDFSCPVILRQTNHLGSSCLSGDIGRLSFQNMPGSAFLVDYTPQCLVDDLDIPGANRQCFHLLRAEHFYDKSVRRFKLFYEPGTVKGAAIGQCRVYICQLEWCDKVEALTDGKGDGFTHLPGFPETIEFPLFRGNQTALFTGEVDAQGGAKAECTGVSGYFVNTQFLTEVIEIDITGLHDCAVEVDMTVSSLQPATKGPVTHLEGAVAVKCRLRGDQPLFESGRSNDGFICGCRRVLSGDRPIFHRMPAVVGEPFPVAEGNAAVEEIRVKGG